MNTTPRISPRTAAILRDHQEKVESGHYEREATEKRQAERDRLVNLMFAIHRLDKLGRRCSKAEVSTWHADTVDALRYLTSALPKVHREGTVSLQKRVYSEIQTLATRLFEEERWRAEA